MKKRKQNIQPKEKVKYITYQDTRRREMADLSSETMRPEGN